MSQEEGPLHTQNSGAAAAEPSGAASHHSSEGNGPHSFGGQVSPRAARSQISTAVSFEGARAAGSAALPSRSLEEESALSAAEADVECSHSAEPNPAAAGHSRPSRGRFHRPSNSLISTAVQPASPHGHAHQPQQQQQQQPVSPKLNRANSVVSHTAPGARQHGGRAGTPASVYGQTPGFLLPSRARQHSPARLGAEQADGAQQPGAALQQQQQPAWAHMPPTFPGLQDFGGLAGQQQGAGGGLQGLQQHPDQQHLPLRLEARDSFDGYHRSSDNGGGRHAGLSGLGRVLLLPQPHQLPAALQQQ
ncbi:hypothetical protein OEZ85_002702 [Tetradesmus obliquus]|uniref:Uncharacterized protein n=1 Tax=Tetradesmus obliquus TaxID=3088 RepID=A0ABY8TYD0_TETOB|nr:hypothetical protein OEZ85_002702 [Tetradesmus obliquus]